MILLLLACSSPPAVDAPFDAALTRAGERAAIPKDLLAATSYALTRWDQRYGAVNIEGGVGVMNLHVDGVGPTLAEAETLTGLGAFDLTSDLDANVLGGAMILRARANEVLAATGNPVDTIEEWYPIVAWYSGAPDPLVAEGFAAQVFDYLQYGLVDETPGGELIQIEPNRMPWRQDRQAVSTTGAVDSWVPACSSNYSDYSRTAADIDTIVIHTVEGSYSGAISWMQNCSSQVSAHYVVRSSDGEITQMVQDEDVAWHAGHWDTNLHSIGIEHEGYVSDPDRWYTDNLYRASAELVSKLADQYGIPKDRAHIIGHYEVPGCAYGSGGGSACHTDPGSGWDWEYFMSLVTGTEGGGGGGSSSGLADGPRSGTFSARVTATRYGETDTCAGPVSGAVNAGRLYLSGSCTLVNHPDQSGNMPVTWAGSADGSRLDGTMVVNGRSAAFTGTIGADGSVQAQYAGSEDLGGDVGVLAWEVTLAAAP